MRFEIVTVRSEKLTKTAEMVEANLIAGRKFVM